MIHLVFLDTCIYRQLGVNFWERNDFVNLKTFLDQRGYEILITEVVYNELLDYYTNDIIKPILTEYDKVISKSENTTFFKAIPRVDLTLNEQSAKSEYLKALRESYLKVITCFFIDSEELIEFLIENKQESKKDNTRDFLILKTLILYAIENPKDKLVLISFDKIFRENKFFQKILKEANVKNLLVFDSIASYLNEFGYKFEFLTDDLVLKSINIKSIEKELLKDIKCLPSYIVDYYNTPEYVPDLQEYKIDEIKIFEYYVYSNEKEKLKISIAVLVRVIAIFNPDNNKDFRNYYIEKYHEENRNRVDNFNRPIYDNFILFILEGDLNKEQKKIIRVKVLDFIPDYNVNK